MNHVAICTLQPIFNAVRPATCFATLFQRVPCGDVLGSTSHLAAEPVPFTVRCRRLTHSDDRGLGRGFKQPPAHLLVLEYKSSPRVRAQERSAEL